MSISTDGQPDPIVAGGIAPDAVGSAEIIDGEVMTVDIDDGAITTSKLGNGAVTDVKITGPISVSKLDTDPLARANHTGTQLAATISDLSTAVQAESLSGDVTGTLGATAVGDDSHNHTLSTVTDSGTAAALDVPASGDAAVGEVVKGDDTRLTDSRAPDGSAGGDLSGTYPNPTVVDDSHNHTLSTITDSGTAAASDATDFVAVAGDTMDGALLIDNELTVKGEANSPGTGAGVRFTTDADAEMFRMYLRNDNSDRMQFKGFGWRFEDLGRFTSGAIFSASLCLSPSDSTSGEPCMSRIAAGVGRLTETWRYPLAPVDDDDLVNKKYVDDEVAGVVFGDGYTYDLDAVGGSTSGTTPVETARVDMSGLTAGTYIVHWHVSYSCSNGSGEIEVEITQDPDTARTVLHDFQQGSINNADGTEASGFVEATIAGATESFNIEFNHATGAGSSTIVDAIIYAHRVA